LSQLQKAIARAGRREGTRIGFGQPTREQPRAMLAGVFAADAKAATAAVDAGADLVVMTAADAKSAAALISSLKDIKGVAGALLPALNEPGAAALREAKCDFVISPLGETAAVAVDPERMGQVLIATDDLSDTTLRSLPPLGLDALYVDHVSNAMSLGGQLELLRLSSFASAPLLAPVGVDASVAELRVLRDSGVSAVIAPAGTTKAQMESLITNLKAVPPSRKARREGGDIALVPSMRAAQAEEEDEEEEEDE
jgi:hypothetical protein